MTCPDCFQPASVTIRHATVGAKTVASFGSVKLRRRVPNNRRSTLGDGRRGVQKRNCVSNGFISFMRFSFQTSPKFLQAIPVTARRCVRRDFQQITDFLKRVFVPEFQNDDFPLGHWQISQTPHRSAFQGRFSAGTLKPTFRFKFPREPPPERSPIVQRPVPKTTHTIVLRLFRGFLQVQQYQEGFLHDVLGLSVGKPKGATIQNQFGRFGVIQSFAPRRCLSIAHSTR